MMKHPPVKISSMRAFLFMLFLTLLPLQFSSAASVSCLENVTATQAVQGGHHQGADGVASSSISFDLDCGACHENSAAAVMPTHPYLADPAGNELVKIQVESLSPLLHERPYKPQWFTPNYSG